MTSQSYWLLIHARLLASMPFPTWSACNFYLKTQFLSHFYCGKVRCSLLWVPKAHQIYVWQQNYLYTYLYHWTCRLPWAEPDSGLHPWCGARILCAY